MVHRKLAFALTFVAAPAAVVSFAGQQPAGDPQQKAATKEYAPPQAGGHQADHAGEMFRTAPPRVTIIKNDERLQSPNTQVNYAPIDGLAIIEGDIEIGTAAEAEQSLLNDMIEKARAIDPNDPELQLSDDQKRIVNEIKALEPRPTPLDFQAKQAAVGRLLSLVAVYRPAPEPGPGKEKAQALYADIRETSQKFKASLREKAPGLERTPANAPGGDIGAETSEGSQESQTLFIPGEQFRWKRGVIPFVVDPTLPNGAARVNAAVVEWNNLLTGRIKLRPRRSTDLNWIRFIPSTGCSSRVGKLPDGVPGEQLIRLAGGCLTPQVIHEIGHAVGLWHEQSRNDRNQFVFINTANIQPTTLFNFDRILNNGVVLPGSSFDFRSIMMYPPFAFSRNGGQTIVALNPAVGTNFGNAQTLSTLDIQTVRFMYQLHPMAGPND